MWSCDKLKLSLDWVSWDGEGIELILQFMSVEWFWDEFFFIICALVENLSYNVVKSVECMLVYVKFHAENVEFTLKLSLSEEISSKYPNILCSREWFPLIMQSS
jgi:hypothetical protein